MIGSHTLTLRIPVNWLIAVGIAAALLVGGYIYVAPANRHYVVFSASVLAGAGAALAAVNALDARVAQVRQSRIAAAIDFGHRWTSPEFFHARSAGRTIVGYLKANSNLEHQKQWLQEDAKRLPDLLDVLNMLELLSLAVQADVLDEDLIKRQFRSVVNDYWHATEAFIKNRRAERQNARLLAEFEALFKRWNP